MNNTPTHEVFDIESKQPVFEGSIDECTEWVGDQSDYFLYTVRIHSHLVEMQTTWSGIQALAYDQWKEYGGVSNFEGWYVNWLEDNYLPPKKRLSQTNVA